MALTTAHIGVQKPGQTLLVEKPLSTPSSQEAAAHLQKSGSMFGWVRLSQVLPRLSQPELSSHSQHLAGWELGLCGQHGGSLAACLGSGDLEKRPVFLQLGSGKSSAGN